VSEAGPDTEARDARRIATEARDRAHFEEEALALADQVYRVARRLVGSREEAEDLVQETYARAFRSWRSFTPGTNLRAWLLRILTNKVASAAGEEALETDEVVERLSQDSIVNALSEIPPQFRDVVVLVDIGDFSYADAAQILDVPIGTVMSRLHRGRRALKQHLAEGALS
jgi:RNA polymerase sigma-70 factor (ECF subfamily)